MTPAKIWQLLSTARNALHKVELNLKAETISFHFPLECVDQVNLDKHELEPRYLGNGACAIKATSTGRRKV